MSEKGFQVSEKCVVPEEWKAGIGHDFVVDSQRKEEKENE